MNQEDKTEIENMIDERINVIERTTRLEVQVNKMEKFNQNVILFIILGIVSWVIVQILQSTI